MKQNYLDPNFNPSNLKVPELREILREHNVSYPRTANKKRLIDLFNSNVVEDQRVNTPGHKRVIGDTHLADAAPTAEGSAFKRARTSSVEPIAVAPHTTLSGQPQGINVPDTVKQRLYYSHFNPETFSCSQCGEFFFLITAAEFWEHLKAKHEHLIPNDLEPEGIPSVISSAHVESSSAQIGESSTAPLSNSRTYMDERSPAYEEIIPAHLRNVEESSSAQKEESRPAFLGESSSEIIPASLATQRNSTQTPQDVPAGNDDDFINREIARLKMTEAQKIGLLLYLTKNNNVKAQVKSVLQNFTNDSIRLGYLTALAQAPTTSDSDLLGKQKYESEILELVKKQSRQMEVIMKKMEDLQEDKKVEISVSRVSNRQFRELLEEHGINRRPVEFTVSPTKKPVEPFVWRSDAEEAHAEDYLKWLEVNINLPDSVGFYRASSKRDLFYTSMASNKFILKGTTDVAIVDKVCIRAKEIAAGLRVGIEGKKCVLDKDSMQTCLELISANLSSNYAVVMVLTNFGSYWRFFWLERGAIVSCDFGLQEGIALLEAIVNEATEAGSALQASVDTPYRARCKFNVAISQTSEEIVLPSEELVPEGLERLLRRPKVDIISMLPKRDVADMNDVFDVMTLEERNVWQRKQIFDFMMHVPAFQPSIPESWRSMYS